MEAANYITGNQDKINQDSDINDNITMASSVRSTTSHSDNDDRNGDGNGNGNHSNNENSYHAQQAQQTQVRRLMKDLDDVCTQKLQLLDVLKEKDRQLHERNQIIEQLKYDLENLQNNPRQERIYESEQITKEGAILSDLRSSNSRLEEENKNLQAQNHQLDQKLHESTARNASLTDQLQETKRCYDDELKVLSQRALESQNNTTKSMQLEQSSENTQTLNGEQELTLTATTNEYNRHENGQQEEEEEAEEEEEEEDQDPPSSKKGRYQLRIRKPKPSFEEQSLELLVAMKKKQAKKRAAAVGPGKKKKVNCKFGSDIVCNEDEIWEMFFQQLIAFNAKYNHWSPPQKLNGQYYALGFWTNEQRIKHSMLHSRNVVTKKTEKRMKRLQDIGFDWGSPSQFITWDERCIQLKELIAATPELSVAIERNDRYLIRKMTQNCPGLAKWMGIQYNYSVGIKSGKRRPVSWHMMDKLESLGINAEKNNQEQV